MARMTFENLNAALDTCIAAGSIFNVDFQDWKTYVASRAVEAELQAATNATYLSAGYERTEADEELYWARGGISIVTFPSKKLVATLDGMTGAYAEGVRAVVAKWTPVGDKFRTLKPMIVKGRKPSETPRKTEERTLENTGTCSICGKNVKMDAAGKMVAHGYTIRWGYQSGNCHGVGFDPIEVSDEGLHNFVRVIINTSKREQDTLIALMRNEVGADQKKVDAAIYDKKRTIRWLADDLKKTTGRIETWTAGTLPA